VAVCEELVFDGAKQIEGSLISGLRALACELLGGPGDDRGGLPKRGLASGYEFRASRVVGLSFANGPAFVPIQVGDGASNVGCLVQRDVLASCLAAGLKPKE
jgi:hypothetical protein